MFHVKNRLQLFHIVLEIKKDIPKWLFKYIVSYNAYIQMLGNKVIGFYLFNT